MKIGKIIGARNMQPALASSFTSKLAVREGWLYELLPASEEFADLRELSG